MSADPREAAALADVLARPDDDDARLTYADAIAHRDAERAELIAVQVKLARGRREHYMPDGKSDLLDRERALLHRRGKAWAAPVADLVLDYRFRRGFPEEVTMDTATFLARANELYQRAPVLHLTLRDARDHMAALAASPALARLESLALYKCQIGDEGAKLLAASPHLRRLRWLHLGFNDIGTAGIEALAASPNLPSLGYLGFQGNKIDDPTPRIGGQDEYGMVHDMELPEAGRDLVRRFGDRAWLTTQVRSDWPPDRDAV